MNKTDLVAALSLRADLSKAKAEQALTVLLEAISSSLNDVGSTVTIAGFGSFQVKQRAARKGRNPVNGEIIEIPSRPAVTFRPSQKLNKSLLE
jgi:nucleoid DNA-binding protein